MSNPFSRRALVVPAILGLVVLSTVSVTHGHLDANSADESRCPLCMAVHSAKYAVAAPIVTLRFTAVQTDMLVASTTFAVVFVQPRLIQARPPPGL